MSRPSLSEVFRSVPVPAQLRGWRALLRFVGPGAMVAVGYVDPGNWATDLGSGSRYGYALLWVILLSSLMAMFLQSLCVRLGIAAQLDLAQASRQQSSRAGAIAQWILCEIAIIACDLAEVIGSAIALNLLFGIPLVWGVLITAADVFLLMALMHFGFRKLEAIVVALMTTIAGCFLLQLLHCRLDGSAIARGLTHFSLPDQQALVLAIGVLGATVMPHNLYLHSSIVQTREVAQEPSSIGRAIRWGNFDVILALGSAFFINAAIMIVSAAAFHGTGPVENLEQAHELLRPILGGAAATAFAVALLCSGQSATITGTLAGQIVMEGFLDLRVRPWVRRLITRGIAIIPALILVSISGGEKTVEMLVLSQVVLSMQLPFAIFPLVKICRSQAALGEFRISSVHALVGYLVGTVITLANLYLLATTLRWEVLAGMVVFAGVAYKVLQRFYPESPHSPSNRPSISRS